VNLHGQRCQETANEARGRVIWFDVSSDQHRRKMTLDLPAGRLGTIVAVVMANSREDKS
jgi:hypothetical protein